MERRPNILFFLADDLGPWALGCCGNEEIITPNIDRLAEQGMRFENFFCTSPVCSPARASILTGTLPSSHGVHDWIKDGNLPPNPIGYLDHMPTYTDILSEHGYTCAIIGKWHLGDSLRPQHGFTHWFCHPKGSGPYNDQMMIRNGEFVQTSGYLTDVISEEACSFIRTLPNEEPFCLHVHYTAPHSPWTGHPERYLALYDECTFSTCPQEPMHPWAGPLTRTSLGNRDFLAGYFAAVTAMDEGIGLVMRTLQESGQADDTIVIFSSDNGFSCGHHGFWGKGNGTFPLNMYENSVKVPFIITYPPAIVANTTTTALASQYDILPTLLDFAELEDFVPDTLPGSSFLPLCSGEQEQFRDEVVIFDEYGPVRMIRTERYKYVHRYPYGLHELYDLDEDRDERVNRIDDPACQAILNDLRSRLRTWFATFGDPRFDGSTLPVSGSGQVDRVDVANSGEAAFSTDRIVYGASGFPKIDETLDLHAVASYTNDEKT